MWTWEELRRAIWPGIPFPTKAARLYKEAQYVIRAKECGHSTSLVGYGYRFGRLILIELDPKTPEYCVECVANMAIQCACCAAIIDLGQSVGVFSPAKRRQRVSKEAVYDSRWHGYIVCRHCTQTEDQRGVWWPPGEVRFDLELRPSWAFGSSEELVFRRIE